MKYTTEKLYCQCGGRHTANNAHHYETKKHKNYLKNNEKDTDLCIQFDDTTNASHNDTIRGVKKH